jgi:anthranilate synthase component 1
MRHNGLLATHREIGTVSGAPKVRAMELIAELEREKRGVYAGAVGYFGYGNVDGDKEIEGAMDVSLSLTFVGCFRPYRWLINADVYCATHHASQRRDRISPSRGKLSEGLLFDVQLTIGQGGIVFDSDPYDEWMETINKLGAFISLFDNFTALVND